MVGIARRAARGLPQAAGLSLVLATALAIPPAWAGGDHAAVQGAVHDTKLEALAHRLFPVLDALAADPAAIAALVRRQDVAALLAVREKRVEACDADLACLAQAQVWGGSEAKVLGEAVATQRPGGEVAADVVRELEGADLIVRTYGLGEEPRYPAIDGAGPITPVERQTRLQAAAWLAQTPRARSLAAIDPGLEFALALLDGSDRTDAIRFEPLEGGDNAPAMARAKTLDWSAWRYSALVVTGVGPEVEGQALSPLGKYHVRLAASRFAKGDAPFILLTGGHAHPRATRFAEAEEMRKALIARYHVAPEAIVIEPYARHTTTNLRNAARVLAMLHAPSGKDALIVCNPGQSAYIESASFRERNARELGYQPGTIGPRLSPTELVFRPSDQSLRIDPRDPLDP